MAKITRINPKTISKPFTNYAHVVTVEGAKKLVFCAGQVAADVDGKVLPPEGHGVVPTLPQITPPQPISGLPPINAPKLDNPETKKN